MLCLSRAHQVLTTTFAAVPLCLLAACENPEAPPTPDATSEPASAATVTQASVAGPDPRQRQQAEVAWEAKVDAIGQPVTAGPAVLILARDGDAGLELVSLDRSTGSQNFAVPFHPGALPTGMAMTPRVTRTGAGRHLAIARRYETAAIPALVALDVRTGAIAASTSVAIDDYDACSDGRDVCWSGYKGGSDKFGPLPGGGPARWDLESGRVLENRGQDAAMLVGSPDLYVRGEGRTSVLSRLQGTQKSRWTQSVSLSVAPGVSPAYGWSFEHDGEANVYTGSMGKPVAPRVVRQFERGKPVAFSYRSRYLTVGIDGRTGEQLWSRRGADPWCHLVRSLPNTRARTLCVVSGSRISEQGRRPVDKGLEVDVQGVDPKNGDIVWTFRLEGKDAVRAYANEIAPLSPFGVVLPSAGGPVALDERDGALQRVDKDAVLLCPTGPDRITVYGVERVADELYEACTPSGRPVEQPLSAFGVAGLEGEGAVCVVSMPGRVVAYRLP